LSATKPINGGMRPIIAAPLLVTALALVVAYTVPASGPIIDIGAAVCGAGTWIGPLLILARSWHRKPRTSLGSVGVVISMVFVAACLSATGLSLALITLAFVPGGQWAWPALIAIAAFWLSVGVLIYVGERRHRATRQRSEEQG
jgi:hypothetical protein